MKSFETVSKPSSTREDRGYIITSTGNVVVDVDRLLSSEKVKGIAEMAKSIVQRHKRSVE
jgi:ribose 5-phosphate isomerase